jgi:hypothetical protein
MNRTLAFLVAIVCFTSCGEKKQSKLVAAESWYSPWIKDRDGRVLHSEISLDPGEVTTVEMQSEASRVVGFVVEKGFDISKEKSLIFMGSEDDPHALGASVGTWKAFEPKDGLIRLRLENGSGISTKVAIYTAKP